MDTGRSLHLEFNAAALAALSAAALLIDVRRQPAFDAGSRNHSRRAPAPAESSRRVGSVARAVASASSSTACAVTRSSQGAATALRERGLDARYLAGGLERWRADGNATNPFVAPTRWVTRERPKIDRIACPWLVRRFIDPAAEFFYVPTAQVREIRRGERRDAPTTFPMSATRTRVASAASTRSSACTISTIRRSPSSPRSSAAPIPARSELARGGARLARGVARARRAMFADDHAMLKWGMLVYDSLYAWCREAQQPRRTAGIRRSCAAANARMSATAPNATAARAHFGERGRCARRRAARRSATG